jgi:putative endonuclease
VKSVTGSRFGDPLDAVTDDKVRRVRSAAEVWLARHPETRRLAVRFDVIAERSGRIQHVPNAF